PYLGQRQIVCRYEVSVGQPAHTRTGMAEIQHITQDMQVGLPLLWKEVGVFIDSKRGVIAGAGHPPVQPGNSRTLRFGLPAVERRLLAGLAESSQKKALTPQFMRIKPIAQATVSVGIRLFYPLIPVNGYRQRLHLLCTA